jgi:hypothetical protein
MSSRTTYHASGVMPLFLPTHNGKRRVKGEVDSIDYHAFVINIPVIHRDCLEKKKLVPSRDITKQIEGEGEVLFYKAIGSNRIITLRGRLN